MKALKNMKRIVIRDKSTRQIWVINKQHKKDKFYSYCAKGFFNYISKRIYFKLFCNFYLVKGGSNLTGLDLPVKIGYDSIFHGTPYKWESLQI